MKNIKPNNVARLRRLLSTQLSRQDAIARRQATQRLLGMPPSPHLQKLAREAEEAVRKLRQGILRARPRFGIIAAVARPDSV